MSRLAELIAATRPATLVAAMRWTRYCARAVTDLTVVPELRLLLGNPGWQELWRKDIRPFVRYAHKMFGIQVEIFNPERVPLEPQYVLVANHRSWFDQLALIEGFERGIHFLAHQKYFELPVFGHTFRKIIQGIPVENRKLSEENQSVLREYLKRGDWVCYYPEGTRGSGRELLPFRSGAFRVSAEHGIPVLPLYIFGAEAVLSKQKSMLTVRGGEIVVRVGVPQTFSPDGLDAQIAAFEAKYRANYQAWYDEPRAAPGGSSNPPRA